MSHISKGVRKDMNIGESMSKAFEQAMEREFQLHLILFTELTPFFISKFDRDLKSNANTVRDFIRNMIRERRETTKATISS